MVVRENKRLLSTANMIIHSMTEGRRQHALVAVGVRSY